MKQNNPNQLNQYWTTGTLIGGGITVNGGVSDVASTMVTAMDVSPRQHALGRIVSI